MRLALIVFPLYVVVMLCLGLDVTLVLAIATAALASAIAATWYKRDLLAVPFVVGTIVSIAQEVEVGLVATAIFLALTLVLEAAEVSYPKPFAKLKAFTAIAPLAAVVGCMATASVMKLLAYSSPITRPWALYTLLAISSCIALTCLLCFVELPLHTIARAMARAHQWYSSNHVKLLSVISAIATICLSIAIAVAWSKPIVGLAMVLAKLCTAAIKPKPFLSDGVALAVGALLLHFLYP